VVFHALPRALNGEKDEEVGRQKPKMGGKRKMDRKLGLLARELIPEFRGV
jgi:hypothetical protein